MANLFTATTQGVVPSLTGERAHTGRIIVFGNAKGGTGKSTMAMHVIVGLLREGYRVGAVDLDAKQGTLSRYFDNRRVHAAQQGLQLPHPLYRTIGRSEMRDRDDARAEECDRLVRAIDALSSCDFIVLDTPGSDNHLSHEGHFHADILVTPLNDSFVDLDLLGRVDQMTHELIELGQYTHMVQTQDKRRAQIGKEPIDWIVMRNRLATLNSRNNQNMELALTGIARRLDLCMVAGFSERVIFRELFLKGLTLLDIRDQGTNVKLTTSHLAALQEVRSVMQAICAVRREPSMVAGSKPVL